MAKNQQEKGKGLDVNVLALSAIGVAITMWIAWFTFHNFITWLAMRTRQYELLALGTLAKPFIGDNNMLRISEFYANNSSVNLTFSSFVQIMKESGIYVVYIYCPIIVWLGIHLWRLSPTENFKRNHTMESLSKQESELWPEIKPPLMFNLDKGNMQKGPWRIALTEWEFARKYELLYRENEGQQSYHIPGSPIEDLSNPEIFDKSKARALFSEQLGNRWVGYKKLPPYIKGIYAALSVRISAIPLIDTKVKKSVIAESDRLFRLMASDYVKNKGDVKKMDFSWADDIVEKTKSSEFIVLTHQRHAYIYTVMATMLQIARADGVLASAMFTWLRPTDRRLWYILENVGGYCFVPESAGIAAHWLAEKEIGIKLLNPYVEEAVKGLDFGLKQYQEKDEITEYFK